MTTLVSMLPRSVLEFYTNLCCIFLTLLFKLGFLQIKFTSVTRIFKGGESWILENYRPIYVLSGFSKIVERIMYNHRLYKYLTDNNILYKKQFGFQTRHSTEHAIIQLVDQITSNCERDQYTLGVFIDISKSFDTIDHKILIAKLENYGINEINLL